MKTSGSHWGQGGLSVEKQMHNVHKDPGSIFNIKSNKANAFCSSKL